MGENRQTRHLRLFESDEADTAAVAYYDRSLALVIGIDEYEEHPRLANAVNDARAVAELLEEIYNFDEVFSLYNEQATYAEMMTWLRDELPARARENDRLVIFYAGHGTTYQETEKGFLVPSGAGKRYADYIDMAELQTACNNYIPAKHILIVLDCCFSGIMGLTRTAPRTPDRVDDAFLRRITQRPARIVLTAGTSDEPAADSSNRPGHSAFTSALLDGLAGEADQDQDGLITTLNLANYVTSRVAQETKTRYGVGQTPFLGRLQGSSGQGDVVFVRSVLETPVTEATESLSATTSVDDLPISDVESQSKTVVKTAVEPDIDSPRWLLGRGKLIVVVLAIVLLAGAAYTLNVQTQRAQLAAEARAATVEVFETEKARRTEEVRASAEARDTEEASGTAEVRATAETRATEETSATAEARAKGEARSAAETVATGEALEASGRLRKFEGIEFVYVPSGEFLMGSSDLDTQALDIEKPQHTVYLDGYWIMRSGVTNALYSRCVAAGGCNAPNNSRWNDNSYAIHPVTDVTWNDATFFAVWFAKQIGQTVRLPTEAEWEKACRGTDARIYPWGNGYDANRLNADGDEDGYSETAPIGRFPNGASPYGALGMAGNLWEWTADRYSDEYYRNSPHRNPAGPEEGGNRTLRGGSWVNSGDAVRCAARLESPLDNGDAAGIRVVLADSADEPPRDSSSGL